MQTTQRFSILEHSLLLDYHKLTLWCSYLADWIERSFSLMDRDQLSNKISEKTNYIKFVN